MAKVENQETRIQKFVVMDKYISKSLKSYYDYLKKYGYLKDNELFRLLTFVQVSRVIDKFSDQSEEKGIFEQLLNKINRSSKLYDFYDVQCCKSKSV